MVAKMAVVAIANLKGGVSKSTLARLLAEYAALCGHRTLLVDLDLQASITQRFLQLRNLGSGDGGDEVPPVHPAHDPHSGDGWSGVSSSCDIYTGEGVYPYPTAYKNLHIIPSWGPELEKLLSTDGAADALRSELHAWLSMDDVKAAYDITVIDTPPSTGPVIDGVVHAASHLVIPSQLEPQSLEGLYKMLHQWRTEGQIRPEDRPLDLVGVLPTQFRASTRLHNELLASLLESVTIAPHVIPHRLSMRTAFAESDHRDAVPRSVFSLPESNKARQEGEEVCEYILAKVLGAAHMGRRVTHVSA